MSGWRTRRKRLHFVDALSVMNKVLSNIPSEIPVGTTILYPTETVYGLGCRYDDDDALKAIYRLKGRDGKVPVALIASERSWVEEHFHLPPTAAALMNAHWPGPLAMLLKPIDPEHFRNVIHEGFVGVRVSGSAVSRALAEACGGGIVSTSANLSGEPTPLSWRQCPASIREGVSLVIDGGELAKAPPSTLIRFDESGAVEVLRQGSVQVNPHASA